MGRLRKLAGVLGFAQTSIGVFRQGSFETDLRGRIDREWPALLGNPKQLEIAEESSATKTSQINYGLRAGRWPSPRSLLLGPDGGRGFSQLDVHFFTETPRSSIGGKPCLGKTSQAVFVF